MRVWWGAVLQVRGRNSREGNRRVGELGFCIPSLFGLCTVDTGLLVSIPVVATCLISSHC